jgi:hypothetical protein
MHLTIPFKFLTTETYDKTNKGICDILNLHVHGIEVILTNQALFTKNRPSILSPVYADTRAISSRYTQNSLTLHAIYYISYKAA